MEPIHRSRATGDRGVALILFAIALVALLAVAGLVIDGGRAYAERRQMQNAADASAMAGARQLNEVRDALLTVPPVATDESSIYQAALQAATTNGADGGGEFSCTIVDETGGDLGPCPQSDDAPLPGGTQAAAGVSVDTHDTEETALIRVVGTETFRAAAAATAQVQGLREIEQSHTPFMICGIGRSTSLDSPGAPPLVVPNGAEWKVNPAAVWSSSGTWPAGESDDLAGQGGPWYVIHGDAPGCGAGSAWKGLVKSGDFALPGWWDGDTGKKAGPTREIVENECLGASEDGCVVIVPICVDGNGNGSGSNLYCVRFGAFKIVKTHSNQHHAAFLGDAVEVIGTGGGGGVPDLHELRVIKLTE